MNPIQTIRMGILACAAACALGACTQSANGPGARGGTRQPWRTVDHDDARREYVATRARRRAP